MTDKNQTRALAVLYHASVLGRPMEFDTSRGKIIMANCKTALKTAAEFGGGFPEVMGLMLGLHSGDATHIGAKYTEYTPWKDWAPKRKLQVPLPLWVLWKMNVPGKSDLLLIQDVCQVPEKPPMNDFGGWQLWVIRYGIRALENSTWNGILPYPTWCEPELTELPPSKLRDIIPLAYADLSVNFWKETRDRLNAQQQH